MPDQKTNFRIIQSMALNDDLSLTLTAHQVAETRSKIDCPIKDPDAILQIMFSGRHISLN